MAIGHNFSGLRVLYLTLEMEMRLPIRSAMTKKWQPFLAAILKW